MNEQRVNLCPLRYSVIFLPRSSYLKEKSLVSALVAYMQSILVLQPQSHVVAMHDFLGLKIPVENSMISPLFTACYENQDIAGFSTSLQICLGMCLLTWQYSVPSVISQSLH